MRDAMASVACVRTRRMASSWARATSGLRQGAASTGKPCTAKYSVVGRARS